MIDIFACAKNLHCRIHNCHVIAEGVESDHAAVRLDLILTSLKRVNSTALNRGTTVWRKIATDPPTTQCYNDALANLLNNATVDSPDMPIEVFNNVIKKAGEDTDLLVGSPCDNWFHFNADKLAPSIEERNQVLHALRSSADLPPSIADSLRVKSGASTKMSKTKCSSLKHAGLLTYVPRSTTCPPTHVSHGNTYVSLPKETLPITKKVKMAMKMTDGKLTSNGKECMTVFGPHFDRVFNNHRPVDPTILDDIPQRPILNDIDSPITFAKVDAAINKLKNGKVLV